SDFVTSGDGGLDNPHQPVFGPDGKLYVNSHLSNAILRFDGTTGAFLDEFIPSDLGGLNGPLGLAFQPNGDLLVSSNGTDQIKRYQGTTGAYLGDFVTNHG